MSPANQRANIAEELAHAEEALRAAEALLGLSLFRDAANRRFFPGNAPSLDARELITRLSTTVDEALHRAEEEARRAERRATRLRQLGIDPDEDMR